MPQEEKNVHAGLISSRIGRETGTDPSSYVQGMKWQRDQELGLRSHTGPGSKFDCRTLSKLSDLLNPWLFPTIKWR